nr:AMP-binding protein [Candidatus Sigynarchaeota archaeon]
MENAEDQLLFSLKENKYAPRFNYEATDMLTGVFLAEVKAFESSLKVLRKDTKERKDFMLKKIRGLLNKASKNILEYMNLDILKVDLASLDEQALFTLLEHVPLSKREDLAQRPWRHVPVDMSLDNMIVYRTAGTTAEPMAVPSHPVATGCYSPLLVEAMAAWNVEPNFSPGGVGIALVGFQAKSVTVAARLQALNNSGFVKINIMESEWRDPLDPYRYILDINPSVLTGDPFSFSQLAHLGDLLIENGEIEEHYCPAALITTAVALKDAIRKHLVAKFRAPVIDLYSLTETGPIAYGCKAKNGYHVLPHDIHLEVVDKEGHPLPEGELGEIVITGGRNPYFPLIRYRTGDWGRLDFSTTCECGDKMPRIVDLEGRMPVLYHTPSGNWINNRDITAVLDRFPVTRFTFHQDSMGAFTLIARLAPFDKSTEKQDLELALKKILGEHARIDIKLDPNLGDRDIGKVIPFTTDFPLFYD